MTRYPSLLTSFATAALSATVACTSAQTRPTPDQVLAELARRSTVPEAKLKALLADCNANQQAMYFCAFRDVVAADLTLDWAVEKKARESPTCKAALERMAADFKRSRDAQCANAAAEEYAGGSMEPTARAICVAASTSSMIERVQRPECR